MTGPRPSGRMRPSLRALPPRCLPLPRRVSFPGAGICRKTAKSTPLPQRIPSEGTTGDSCFLPGCEQTGECVRRRLRPGKSRPRRPENTAAGSAPDGREVCRPERRAALLRSDRPRPLPTAPDRFRPGGFGARCGEKEAAAELQRGQQQRVPSGADSVIRPPGIPFSDIPGTDRTGNGHGPAA